MTETEAIRMLFPSQQTPKVAGHHQKPGRGKEGSSPGASRGQGPADTLILTFRPPELRENTFLLFYGTQFVVVCYDIALGR